MKKVLEQGTEYPLEYATVSFIDPDGKIATGGVTDLNGAYEIKVPVGTYAIQFEFISYEPNGLKTGNLLQIPPYPPCIWRWIRKAWTKW